MRVLLVEDDATYRKVLVDALARDEPELEVVTAATLEEALAEVDRAPFALILLDAGLPATAAEARAGRVDARAGERLLERLESRHDGARRVVLSAQERERAVKLLLAHRIHDYLFKETPWPEVRARLRAQLEQLALEERNRALAGAGGCDDELVGRAPALHAALERVDRVAPTDSTVLILGETGAGKELIARRIHRLSRRAAGPFVAVHCAALSEGVLESELFGHARGAFTGALESRAGRFELADGGTLFLDEAGEIPPAVQAKLLRVLQERTFERVGETRPRRADVRVVSATNRDLEKEVATGRFRADLFYRLNVFAVAIPPLRERREDIPLLARRFLSELARPLGRAIHDLAPDAAARLAAADWPGNVRQLRNTIESAMIVESGSRLEAGSLPPLRVAPAGVAAPGVDAGDAAPAGYHDALRAFERAFLARALAQERGDTAAVAECIGLPQRTLRDRLKACGLDAAAFRRP